MGDTTSSTVQPARHFDEGQILQRATEIVLELNLFKNQLQEKQQRHLIARILVYQGDHIIKHLQSLPADRQELFIRILKTIDYETIDLYYQNTINIRNKKIKCQAFKSVRKHDIQMQRQEMHDEWAMLGEQALKNGKVGVIMFVGGESYRFVDHEGKKHDKAFYPEKEEEVSLVEIKLEKIKSIMEKYGKQALYIVHHQKNIIKLRSLLNHYPAIPVRTFQQTTFPIINNEGKICFKEEGSCQVMRAPTGCGSFHQLSSRGKSIIQWLEEDGVEMVSCVGVENIHEQVVDPLMLGMLKKQANVVFKCTYAESKDEDLRRIVREKSKQQIIVDDLEHLKCKYTNTEVIDESLVWMNSLAFNLTHAKEYLQKQSHLLTAKRQMTNFSPKHQKRSYWDPLKQEIVTGSCYAFQWELSDILINQHLQCVGLEVDRDKQFTPVISIKDDHIWYEAKKEYKHQETKQEVIVDENMISCVFKMDQM